MWQVMCEFSFCHIVKDKSYTIRFLAKFELLLKHRIELVMTTSSFVSFNKCFVPMFVQSGNVPTLLWAYRIT